MQSDPDTVIAYVHVPKCAGSTIDHHMIRCLADDERWITKRRHWKKMAAGPGHDIHRVRFLSGHFLGRSVERHFADRALKRVILLREPVSFHVSYYNYRMMRYLAHGWGTYSFETHIRSQPIDPISHFILSRWLEIPWPSLLVMSADEKYRRLNEELARFWYVADYQCCDELCAFVSRELGVREDFERSNTRDGWQQRVAWTPLKETDLRPEQRTMIEQRTGMDKALWSSWRAARREVTGLRPLPLPSGTGFAASESVRALYALRRRLQRGWF